MAMLYRNPVSLNQLTIFQTLILQHAAAAQNGLGRSRIIFVASHQRTVNPQLFGNGKSIKSIWAASPLPRQDGRMPYPICPP